MTYRSTERFSNRVGDYHRARPGYPAAVFDWLTTLGVLAPSSHVADIGAGTGLSTLPLLAHANTVYGVEPNQAMRQAAEAQLDDHRGFVSINGTAEATTLPAHSVDLIVAGQAFHWFDPAPTREEWRRILKPTGQVVLMWNERETDSTPFLQAYEALLIEHGTDYCEVNHAQVDGDRLTAFYGQPPICQRFPNKQVFDLDGMLARLRSSSYTPAPGQAGYQPMIDAAQALFAAHQQQGQIEFLYQTVVYCGALRAN
ncbi:SAM-dependent methyltransferase [Chitinivorax tropicus]|uniref:SAM-dependent methyltransferase n=1 Tax=Chitinivorax tropicus TaxID=714531 RepID=A0A840MPV8_9PROT|nr:class I SAM-dependent methyltransferase [Chitinivorax tropicus]MBB5019077.1 SAM-dependent methyltransferase [Chitinivorax tropicus]